MTVHFDINYLAVLVAAISSMILGAIWYGPLFMKAWMKQVGMTAKDLKKRKKKGSAKQMIGAFIMALVMAGVLAAFIQYRGDITLFTGICVAFWAWLGFTATVEMSRVLFERSSFKLFMINSGFNLVQLLIMGLIIAAWP